MSPSGRRRRGRLRMCVECWQTWEAPWVLFAKEHARLARFDEISACSGFDVAPLSGAQLHRERRRDDERHCDPAHACGPAETVEQLAKQRGPDEPAGEIH